METLRSVRKAAVRLTTAGIGQLMIPSVWNYVEGNTMRGNEQAGYPALIL
jgi:hypothetical protein